MKADKEIITRGFMSRYAKHFGFDIPDDLDLIVRNHKTDFYSEPVIVLTEEKLRECFEAGFLNCRWGDDNTFDQWLAKQLKEGEHRRFSVPDRLKFLGD